MYKFQKEVTLYPTVEEYFELSLDDVFYYMNQSRNITKAPVSKIQMNPQVPNVEIIDLWQEIYYTEGHMFQSVSTNNTHFAALSNQNLVI